MTYNVKAILIESILMIVCIIVMLVLIDFFQSKELKILEVLSTGILTTTLGFYFIFGKYVYFRGALNKKERIVYGLVFIFIAPVIWLILFIAEKL